MCPIFNYITGAKVAWSRDRASQSSSSFNGKSMVRSAVGRNEISECKLTAETRTPFGISSEMCFFRHSRMTSPVYSVTPMTLWKKIHVQEIEQKGRSDDLLANTDDGIVWKTSQGIWSFWLYEIWQFHEVSKHVTSYEAKNAT